MFLRDIVWLHIRDQFTQEEIDVIKASCRSRRCCPPGVHIDLFGMQPALAEKLRLLGMA